MKIKPNELKNVTVKILKCYHTCESIGFGFNTYQMKLKPEYISIDKNEIISIKRLMYKSNTR
jgi:hypothetical protein